MENSGDLPQFLEKFTVGILRYGAPKLVSGFPKSKSEENDIFGQKLSFWWIFHVKNAKKSKIFEIF